MPRLIILVLPLSVLWLVMMSGPPVMQDGGEAVIKVREVNLESAEKGNIISGLVKGGGKPARVTVKINGVTDVETVCPKFECRTKGEVCGHAVAVLLHHIRGLNDVVVEKKRIDP